MVNIFYYLHFSYLLDATFQSNQYAMLFFQNFNLSDAVELHSPLHSN